MNALGDKKLHKNPQYYMDKIGRVTSAARYRSEGRIEVTFLDHGKCMPVWVIGNIDREPKTGDMVIVGYMEGRKDAPYLIGFVRNENYTANYIEVGADYIRFQLPKTAEDRNGKMLDNSKKASRVYLELTASGMTINVPGGNLTINTKLGTQTL